MPKQQICGGGYYTRIEHTKIADNIRERMDEAVQDIQGLLEDKCIDNCTDCEYAYLCDIRIEKDDKPEPKKKSIVIALYDDDSMKQRDHSCFYAMIEVYSEVDAKKVAEIVDQCKNLFEDYNVDDFWRLMKQSGIEYKPLPSDPDKWIYF